MANTKASALVGLGFRQNLIINGGFDFWQRGTSQTNNGYGSADRWIHSNTGSTKTTSRQSFTVGQTDVPGNPKYFSRTVVTSVAGSGNSANSNTKLEDVTALATKTVTLSFYAKADAAKNIAIEFAQSFGSGGSPSSGVTGIGVTTKSLTTSWARYTVTATLPSVSGKTLGTDNNDCTVVLFWFDAGSDFNARTNSLGQQSGTFDIANVMLVEGSTAETFQRAGGTIGGELALCQRYYEKSYSLETSPGAVDVNGCFMSSCGTNGSWGLYTIPFTVMKRVAAQNANITLYDLDPSTPHVTKITCRAAGSAQTHNIAANTPISNPSRKQFQYTHNLSSTYAGVEFHWVIDVEL